MKFLAPVRLAFSMIPVESAAETSGCILRATRTRDASPVRKPRNTLEAVTSAVTRVQPPDRKV